VRNANIAILNAAATAMVEKLEKSAGGPSADLLAMLLVMIKRNGDVQKFLILPIGIAAVRGKWQGRLTWPFTLTPV
jgi:hypothetical protein